MTKRFSSEPGKKKAFAKKLPEKEFTQPVPVVGKRSIFKPRDKKPNFVLGVVLTTIKMSFVAIIVVIAIVFGSVLGVANAYLGRSLK